MGFQGLGSKGLLEGIADVVSRIIVITLLTDSHHPPSRASELQGVRPLTTLSKCVIRAQ